MKNTFWRSGDYNAICDVCGKKFKASKLKTRWDGLKVCSEDWEVRHPQELIRSIPDQTKLNWTRPEPVDNFLPVTTQLLFTETLNISEVFTAELILFDANIGINGSMINERMVDA